jgi:hypothetical protein
VPSAGDVRAVVDTNVVLSGLLWRGRPNASNNSGQLRRVALFTDTHRLADHEASLFGAPSLANLVKGLCANKRHSRGKVLAIQELLSQGWRATTLIKMLA